MTFDQIIVEDLATPGCSDVLLKFAQAHGLKTLHVVYVDGREAAARIEEALRGDVDQISFSEYDYQLPEQFDEQANLEFFNATTRYQCEFREILSRSAEFAELAKVESGEAYDYLLKCCTHSNIQEHGLVRSIYLMCVCHSLRVNHGVNAALVLANTLWAEEHATLAASLGVELLVCGESFSRNHGLIKLARLLIRIIKWQLVRLGGGSGSPATDQAKENLPARVCVRGHGLLNVSDFSTYSDLFFVPDSELEFRDVHVAVELARDALSSEQVEEFHKLGLTLCGRAKDFVPGSGNHFRYVPSGLLADYRKAKQLVSGGGRKGEVFALRNLMETYEGRKRYWTSFFERYNCDVHVGFEKTSSNQIALAGAMRQRGGISCLYQRSLECVTYGEMFTVTDVMFVYASMQHDVEKRLGTKMRNMVVTGYLGDHRIEMLRPRATRLQNSLRQKGCRKVVAYFDENSLDDSLFFFGHQAVREDYAFWLQKVLETPDFGLILKPKKPGTLRARLASVAGLLDEALATGRCVLVDQGETHIVPPLMAALASDVSVHGSMHAGTAGLEAALAGRPSLLYDGESWPDNPLRDLGGDVVFTDWGAMWDALREDWGGERANPGLGNWSPMIEVFDPFRDGRAAERMGNYVKWLLEGLRAGLGREQTLEKAAERYAKQWGRDKVFSYPGC